MRITEKELQEEMRLIERFLHMSGTKLVLSMPQISHQGSTTLAGCVPEDGKVYFPLITPCLAP
jgi:hypothetical protein